MEVVVRVVVSEAAAPVPWGCVCAYTWSGFAGRQVRNGPRPDCGADHTAVDRSGAMGSAEGLALTFVDADGRPAAGVWSIDQNRWLSPGMQAVGPGS